ncbi:hydroxyethylthiazole kinase [Alkalihalobacillus trypoxylicola]|uniref:Hydroxyethylthiazole kinase n=1 Tax=Alkalihalobacillus trypoxylicola TaxID=519424 RepID=A0A162ER14_9BACI|nr:hydroxyethylthiazole kinase [Alkalihalobacillus trypoxylicola]KYG33510.1 hydroxyethylthiazole kinase [Alkalihalobacillus trypoxylicola]
MFLQEVRESNPLIHCITNVVVTNFTANGLLALGASPVMAYSPEEVADMAKVADGLLLNIGTLNQEQVDSMIIAGKAANDAGVPVVLDPVGAGATPFRTNSCLKILHEVNISVLRGNQGEIAALIGRDVSVKGVDGSGRSQDERLAILAAKHFDCHVVVTGAVDYVSDGFEQLKIRNGHLWLTKVVGTGCLLGAVITACISGSVVKRDYMGKISEALSYYGIAGERAYELTRDLGIGSFQYEFLNQLQLIDDEILKKKQIIK